MNIVSKARKLIAGIHDLDILLDVFVGDQAVRVSDTDLNRVLKDRVGTALDFFGPSGGEKERLTILTSHF
jgi:hypothetical protein